MNNSSQLKRLLARAGAVIAASVTLSALLPAAASAMVLEMSVEQMSATASKVVYGEVLSVAPHMGADGDVTTVARIRAARAIKGAPAATIDVTYPGGTIGSLAVVVPDAPALVPGQTALFFLDGQGRPLGWRAGVLDVRRGTVPSQRQTLAHVETRVKSAADLPAALFEQTLDASSAVLQSAPQAVGGPVISSVSPGSAPAGTGSKITITGSGFGATRGAVEFYYRSGHPNIAGGIVSWTDTRIEVVVPVGSVEGYSASAGSGPLTVRTAGGASATANFSVPFGIGANRWAGDRIEFRVNPNGPASGMRAAVDAAGATWTYAADLRMTDIGTTGATKPVSGDGNTVTWAALPSGVLGQASMRYSGGKMIETDFAFNSAYTNWGNGSSGTIDLQSVATHEMGHWLDLRDLYGPGDAGKVMRGIIGSGVQRRALSAGDIAGVRYAYGSPPPVAPITRIAGSNRYTTAVAVSRSTFATATAVVLATGQNFPDALAASGLAGSYRGPLLLTPKDTFMSEVRNEIVRLKATRVLIVGGGASVSPAVARAVDAIPGVSVVRIGGIDRYATAAAIANHIAGREGTGRPAFLVRGDNFADALAVAPYAYSQRLPVLLSARTGITAPTRMAVASSSNLVIAGSYSAVPSNVVSALGGTSSVRVAGADRYATAAAMVGFAVDRRWTVPTTLGVATGQDFPDALGGAAAMGARGGGLLLTPKATLAPTAAHRIAGSRTTVTGVRVFGGTNAVAGSVVSAISASLR